MSVSLIVLGHKGKKNICVIVALRGVTLPSSLSSSASTPVLSVNSFTLTAGRGCVVVKSPWVPQLKDTTKDTPEVSFHNSGRAECLTGKDSLSSNTDSALTWQWKHAKVLNLHRNWLFFCLFGSSEGTVVIFVPRTFALFWVCKLKRQEFQSKRTKLTVRN